MPPQCPGNDHRSVARGIPRPNPNWLTLQTTRIKQIWVDSTHSLLTNAAIQAAYSLNVGNLRDTGHSAEVTPPAALADEETVAVVVMNFRFWPIPATE